MDFSLSLGEISERVTVTGEASLVETTTAQLSALVDQQQIADLPLNGRSYTQLALLQRNGPVVGVVTLAVLWLPSSITQPLWLPAEWPMWAFFALPVLLVVSTVTGGFSGTLCRWYIGNKILRRSAA